MHKNKKRCQPKRLEKQEIDKGLNLIDLAISSPVTQHFLPQPLRQFHPIVFSAFRQ